MVQGCTRTKQTFWTEDEFTVTTLPGIRNRDVMWTLLTAKVWQGCWKQQLRREVQVGRPQVRGVQGAALWERWLTCGYIEWM